MPLRRRASPPDDAAFDQARDLRGRDRFVEAETLYRRALARRSCPKYALYLSECLMHEGKSDEVLRVLAAALHGARKPSSAEDVVFLYRAGMMGLDFKSAARWGRVLMRMTRATRDIEDLYWMIFVEDFSFAPRTRDYVLRALAVLDEFIKKHPHRPWGYYWRGLVNDLDIKRHSRALADWRRAAELARGRFSWMKYRLAVETRDPKLLRAVVRATKPGSWKAQALLVDILIDLGQRAAAERELIRLERLTPDPARERGDAVEGFAYRAKLELRLGLVESALRTAEAGIAAGSQAAWTWKGAALSELGRREEALQALKTALSSHSLGQRPAEVWDRALRRGRKRPANPFGYPSLDEVQWTTGMMKRLSYR